MLRLTPVVLFAALGSMPALAGGYANAVTDTVNLQVQGAAVQMERIGSTYSASGSGVTFTPGAGTAGTATAPYLPAAGTFTQTTAGNAFNFSESITVGDTVGTAVSAPAAGVIGSPANYGIYTTQFAGDKGSLAGSLSTSGVPTITAGGPGTTATAQRSVSLTVFD